MPSEWNMVVGKMWEINPTSKGSLFNYPEIPVTSDPDWNINDHLSFLAPSSRIESEGPYEFTAAMYPDTRRCEFLRSTMTIIPDYAGEPEARIASMASHNELRNNQKFDPCLSESSPKKLDKGKQRAAVSPTDEEIDRLCQHWYTDYEDLLQGVPEGMPPWRVVNHEIPIIDTDKRYHYHLPRCPNALRGEFDEKVA